MQLITSCGTLATAAALLLLPACAQSRSLSPASSLMSEGRRQGQGQQQILLSSDDRPAATTITTTTGVPVPLFASLERLARLVDIAYCVGTTGVTPPFACASRCRDFPELRLVSTWNTGVLMSDSCGYVAVDHGSDNPKGGDGDGEGDDEGGERKRNGAIIVAFRGTYSITNTVVDLSTIPQEYVPYPEPGDGEDENNESDTDTDPEPKPRCANCTVHMGFLASWRSARRLVLPAIAAARAAHPAYPVHLVGHSLGGAVACLAALELRVALGWAAEDVRVTTFGEPRVGNRGLARFVDRVFDMEEEEGDGEGDGKEEGKHHRYYRRVTHANDPVPLLPLAEWGFRPHAGEVFIAKADLSPAPEDLRLCHGDADPACIAGGGEGVMGALLAELEGARVGDMIMYDDDENRESDDPRDKITRARETQNDDDETPAAPTRLLGSGSWTRLKLWQLFFAHRDYFWRLGLCVPGGDPADWGRGRYNYTAAAAAAAAGEDEL